MTNTIYLVIVSNGDGSNGIEYYCDPASIQYLRDCLDEIKKFPNYWDWDKYSSGDGLQVRELVVPCDLDEWAAMQPSWFGWADADLVEN